MRALIAVACICLALIPAACGSDSDADAGGSDEEQIVDVIHAIQRAYKTKDAEPYCSNSIKELQQGMIEAIDAKTCEEGFAKYMELDVVEADVYPKDIKTRVNGDKAWATGYTSHTESRQRAYFKKVGDEWKLAAWFRGDQKDILPWVKGWREEIDAGQ